MFKKRSVNKDLQRRKLAGDETKIGDEAREISDFSQVKRQRLLNNENKVPVLLVSSTHNACTNLRPESKGKNESDRKDDKEYPNGLELVSESDVKLDNTRDITTKTDIESSSTIKAVGPKAPPKNIRVTTLTDFQPDVCKDFQQTGYCGYGDTCKFLHIRDELRQKKVIDKEWENVANKDGKNGGNHGKDDVSKDDMPFKCPICKDDYKNPVKTLCNHQFCKDCFMKRYKEKKKAKCFICKADTGGVVQPVKQRKLESA